ncbi:hypothetical protein [Xanthobacter autotrophicus]|uniref:hypothetical protein n=1 Tax=Xanthobacter autotrophicus TaxID=280 RepID=UPI003726EEF0
MSSADWVIFLTLSMSVISFILYVLQSMGRFSSKPVEPARQSSRRRAGSARRPCPK